MSELSLADAVGRVVAEEEAAIDPRLDRLSRGDLSAAERTQLENDAKADPQLAEAVKIFSPASGGDVDRFVSSAVNAVGGTVLWWPKVVAPMALAAAALVAFFALSGPDYAPMPAMEMKALAGDRTMRSSGTEVPESNRMVASSQITLILRPRAAVQGPSVAAVFSIRDGVVKRVDLPVERVKNSGAARVQATAEAIVGAAPGVATAVLVVARPKFVPDPSQIAKLANRKDDLTGPHWHAASVVVEIH